MLEGLLHGLLGNLVEGDAADLLALRGRLSQLQRQVIGNRLALAVRVGRQIDRVGLRAQLLQLLDDLFLAGRDDQLRHKRPLLQLHANIVLGQVHDVPYGCPHVKALAKILLDRLRLGGGLDDYQ